MKVLLLAPNGGVSLSSGGGSNFVLKQARALALDGHDVTMAGFHALSLEELENQHGVPLAEVRDRLRVVSGGGSFEFRAQRALPGKPSPYFALFDPRVTRWLGGLGEKVRPDLAWFHDDIPRAANWAAKVRTALYVHYPLLARSSAVAPPLRQTRGPGEAAQDAFLRRAAPRIIVTDPSEWTDRIFANSSVTAGACRTIWSRPARVLATYVPDGTPRPGPRSSDILSLAAFHRGKALDLLLEGFLEAHVPGATLTFIGHPRDASYLSMLRKRARSAEDPERIPFRPGASRPEVFQQLGAASAIVSPANFEPFGLAMLEGMAEGATPIARNSRYSGAWTDLLDDGRLGAGFSDVHQLALRLRECLERSRAGPDPRAVERAREYSEARFHREMAEACA